MALIQEVVKAAHSAKSGSELLDAAPSVLRGVNSAAEALLAKRFHISSVFDLAYSHVFETARVLALAVDGLHAFRKHGRLPSDLVDKSTELDGVAEHRPDTLRGISKQAAEELAEVLDIASIRDMASWPPYRAARRLAHEVLVPESLPGFDPEAPADLLPRTGDYPTERVTYTSLVLAELSRPNKDHAVSGDVARASAIGGMRHGLGARLGSAADGSKLDLRQSGVLRISELHSARQALPLAEGALITFSHSWYPQGVALGQLLHSVALAPGETTRIAMIDWSRRTSALQTERIDQTEELTNTTAHTRAISEVARAVAIENQEGRSQTGAEASAHQWGVAAGGLVPGAPVALGGAYGGSVVSSSGWGWSKSTGERDVTADMIADQREYPAGCLLCSQPPCVDRPRGLTGGVRAGDDARDHRLQPHARALDQLLRSRPTLPDSPEARASRAVPLPAGGAA